MDLASEANPHPAAYSLDNDLNAMCPRNKCLQNQHVERIRILLSLLEKINTLICSLNVLHGITLNLYAKKAHLMLNAFIALNKQRRARFAHSKRIIGFI